VTPARRTCAACGNEIWEARARFCSRCSAPLPRALARRAADRGYLGVLLGLVLCAMLVVLLLGGRGPVSVGLGAGAPGASLSPSPSGSLARKSFPLYGISFSLPADWAEVSDRDRAWMEHFLATEIDLEAEGIALLGLYTTAAEDVLLIALTDRDATDADSRDDIQVTGRIFVESLSVPELGQVGISLQQTGGRPVGVSDLIEVKESAGTVYLRLLFVGGRQRTLAFAVAGESRAAVESSFGVLQSLLGHTYVP